MQNNFLEKEQENTMSANLSNDPTSFEIYGSGLVLSAFSPTFYRNAARKKMRVALVFFFLLMVLVTFFQSIAVFVSFKKLEAMVNEFSRSEEFPEFTITNGMATIHTTEPFVYEIKNDRGHVAIILDTTGEYTLENISSLKYTNAFLLTRTQLITYDGTGDPRPVKPIDLVSINQLYGDPIFVDADFVQNNLVSLSGKVSGIAFIGLFFWNVILQIVFISVMAFFMWAIVKTVKKNTSFQLVLSLGIYALVPTIYLTFILNQFSLSICGLRTGILLTFWLFGLVSALGETTGAWLHSQRPLRAWRVLLGIPMLLALLGKLLFPQLNASLVLMVSLITYGILIGISIKSNNHPSEVISQANKEGTP